MRREDQIHIYISYVALGGTSKVGEAMVRKIWRFPEAKTRCATNVEGKMGL